MSRGTVGRARAGSGGRGSSEIPRAGWRDILLRLKDAVRDDRITLIAAGVAFYAMLALFPAMIVVVSIYGLVMDPEQIAAQVRTWAFCPATSARSSPASSTPWPVPQRPAQPEPGVQVLVALWSASAGMRALVTGVNAAYSEAETRGFVRLRGLALVLTLGEVWSRCWPWP